MVNSNNLKLATDLVVYPPKEDTWFLTDVLETQFRSELSKNPSSFLVCEVGIGSGFISITLSKKFPWIHFIGVDISPRATVLCHKNISNLSKSDQFDIICMDLLQGFNNSRFYPTIVFFNPPYVRTSQEELEKGFLQKTWAGGPTGVTIVQRFLKDLSRFMFKKAFFLSSIFNNNEIFETKFFSIFDIHIIAEKKIGDERLLCYEVKPIK